MKVPISDIKHLLASGKSVKIKSMGGDYFNVSNFYEKGILPTYQVVLENGNTIKVSNKHMFFTHVGWLATSELIPNRTQIFCDDFTYSIVKSVDYIGEYPIVDIQVDQSECYFGNGMLNHNSGKSLMSYHLLAETQKKGGVAVLIDTETAVDNPFMEAIGVDLSKLVYVSLDTVEEIFAVIETIIAKVREKSPDTLVTIVVDSVAGATTEIEQKADYQKDGWATAKAIILSKALRKITNMIGRQKVTLVFTNQLRMKLSAGLWEDPYCVDPLTTKIKIRYPVPV